MLDKIFFWRNKFAIEMAEGADESAMAIMLEDIIKTNLENSKKKVRAFRKIRGNIGIVIDDVDMEIGLKFKRGTLTITPKVQKRSKVKITADSTTVTQLSTVPIKYGLPWYFDETGKEILKAAIDGKLKIKGAAFHVPTMIRLSKVMSVH